MGSWAESPLAVSGLVLAVGVVVFAMMVGLVPSAGELIQ